MGSSNLVGCLPWPMLPPGLPLEPTVRSRYLSCGQTLFDTELPEQARLELERPRRPRILEGQKPATLNSGAKWPLYLVLLGCALVIGGSLATWRQGQTAERARKAISQPTPAPQPVPITPPPTPGPTESGRAYLANNPPAPRAMLVKRSVRGEAPKYTRGLLALKSCFPNAS